MFVFIYICIYLYLYICIHIWSNMIRYDHICSYMIIYEYGVYRCDRVRGGGVRGGEGAHLFPNKKRSHMPYPAEHFPFPQLESPEEHVCL